MDHQFLQELNSERDNWIVKVRVVRLWNVFTPQNEEDQIYIEMILIDEKGTPLHASVRKNLIAKFNPILREGKLYTIRNLKVVAANDNYKPVTGAVKAIFLLTTTVKELEDSSLNIPNHYFEFASLQILSERVGEKTMLTDIIGRLHALGHIEEINVSGRKTRIRRMELILKENEKVKVTLWQHTVHQIDPTLCNQNTGPVTVAITSTLVKKFKDDYSINSTTSTRIYINLNISESADLTNRVTTEENQVHEIMPQEQIEADLAKRMTKNRRLLKDILDINIDEAIKEKVFTINATINDIDQTYGWYYVACDTCMRKLTKEGQQFTCKTCNRASKYPTTRFKIQLKVSDTTAAATLTMFDRDAQKLLSTTATDLLTTQDGNTTDIPPILKNLCGRNLIFEIKVTDYNFKEGLQNYTVTKTFIPKEINEDQHLKNMIKQEPISEDSSSQKQESSEDSTMENQQTLQQPSSKEKKIEELHNKSNQARANPTDTKTRKKEESLKKKQKII